MGASADLQRRPAGAETAASHHQHVTITALCSLVENRSAQGRTFLMETERQHPGTPPSLPSLPPSLLCWPSLFLERFSPFSFFLTPSEPFSCRGQHPQAGKEKESGAGGGIGAGLDVLSTLPSFLDSLHSLHQNRGVTLQPWHRGGAESPTETHEGRGIHQGRGIHPRCPTLGVVCPSNLTLNHTSQVSTARRTF